MGWYADSDGREAVGSGEELPTSDTGSWHLLCSSSDDTSILEKGKQKESCQVKQAEDKMPDKVGRCGNLARVHQCQESGKFFYLVCLTCGDSEPELT